LGFAGANLDRADILLGNMPATAEQRENPTRIGIIIAANVHPEPYGIIKSGMIARGARFRTAFGTLATLWPITAFRPVTTPITSAAIKHILSRRELGPVNADERCGNIFRTTFGKQPRAKCPILILKLNRR
jgi:hypothetical protein